MKFGCHAHVLVGMPLTDTANITTTAAKPLHAASARETIPDSAQRSAPVPPAATSRRVESAIHPRKTRILFPHQTARNPIPLHIPASKQTLSQKAPSRVARPFPDPRPTVGMQPAPPS